MEISIIFEFPHLQFAVTQISKPEQKMHSEILLLLVETGFVTLENRTFGLNDIGNVQMCAWVP